MRSPSRKMAMSSYQSGLQRRRALVALFLASCLGITSCGLMPAETAAESPDAEQPPSAGVEPSRTTPEPTQTTAPATPTSVAEYETFAGSAWGITFEFVHPMEWTVSPEPDSQRSSFSILDEQGAQVAGLYIHQFLGLECYPPCETFPLLQLDKVPSDGFYVKGVPLAVRTVAMDLSSHPEQRRQAVWDDQVRLVVGLGGDTDLVSEESNPQHIYGYGSVRLGLDDELAKVRLVSFNKVDDFPDLRSAIDYVGTDEYQMVQDMIKSFTARPCTGAPDEPESYTGPGNGSATDLCAASDSTAEPFAPAIP